MRDGFLTRRGPPTLADLGTGKSEQSAGEGVDWMEDEVPPNISPSEKKRKRRTHRALLSPREQQKKMATVAAAPAMTSTRRTRRTAVRSDTPTADCSINSGRDDTKINRHHARERVKSSRKETREEERRPFLDGRMRVPTERMVILFGTGGGRLSRGFGLILTGD